MTGDLKASFHRARTEAERAHRSGSAPADVAGLLSARSDEILAELFEGAVGGRDARTAGVALVAVGGYGRGELAPGSDLDVLLVHRGLTDERVAEINKDFLYPLWDAGLEVGNRTRRLSEALGSLSDVEESTALLDARYVAGDRALFVELETNVREILTRRRASFFRELREATDERHRKHGHAGHLLEPDIREAAGGLRDVQTIRWLAAVLPGGPGFGALVETGVLGAADERSLEDAHRALLRIRIESHLANGRREDRLHLEMQDEIARRLRPAPQTDGDPGDRMMQEVYRTARGVHAIAGGVWDDLMRRRVRRRPWRPAVRTIGDGCVIRDGRLEVVAVTSPDEDPAGWLRVFRHALRESVPVSRASLRRLEAAMSSLTSVGWTPEARDLFVEILRWGPEAIDVLETMDRCGLLPGLLPEWRAISGLPQRDLYHRYTVDMHLFHVVAEVASSRGSDEAAVADAWSRVDDDTALLVAALVHDIAKGRGGNHAEAGAALAEDMARRTGLGPDEVEDVAFLVAEHLTLASLATHRDTSDPRTVEEAAARTATPRRLAMLFLLTRADSLATGPEAWSVFRAALIRELYGRTLASIEGGTVATEPVDDRSEVPPLGPGESFRATVRHDEHGEELVVVARDRPGLFATVCGVLAVRGIDVHSAQIATREDGIAHDTFRVRGLHGPIPEDRWDRIREDVVAALDGRLDVDEALRRKARHIRRRSAPVRAPQVLVDNEASAASTVIEVRAADRLGILRLIAKTLTDAGCDIRLAKVATYGAEVVDVFYVTDTQGRRVEDPQALEALRASLTAALRQAE